MQSIAKHWWPLTSRFSLPSSHVMMALAIIKLSVGPTFFIYSFKVSFLLHFKPIMKCFRCWLCALCTNGVCALNIWLISSTFIKALLWCSFCRHRPVYHHNCCYNESLLLCAQARPILGSSMPYYLYGSCCSCRVVTTSLLKGSLSHTFDSVTPGGIRIISHFPLFTHTVSHINAL